MQGQYRAAARAQQGTVLYSNELCLFATTLRHGLCLSLGLCFDLRCTGCIKYAACVCVRAYMSETRSAVPLERCAHTLCGAPATTYYSNATEDHIWKKRIKSEVRRGRRKAQRGQSSGYGTVPNNTFITPPGVPTLRCKRTASGAPAPLILYPCDRIRTL